ncbi:GT-D fold domain-containing glycosyltransferase [Salipaludibacillus sp. HK11]|uniref:GT-D fold domain-containing protein n=1 Tax=Salipaludibacillus sp. HK11 TaxID=3394320 RepID=UPI0039FCAAA8
MNRFGRLEELYQRKGLRPDRVISIINRAIVNKKPLALIRVGDVPTTFLCKRSRTRWKSKKKKYDFFGVSYPPPASLVTDLHDALKNADIVGLRTNGKGTIIKQQDYLKEHNITPRYITDAFISDDLYKRRYYHRLLKSSRVALIGREASNAVKQLQKKKIIVKHAYNLDHYDDISHVYNQLKKTAADWDILLCGAGMSGFILCPMVARKLNKVALDIGHVMDGFAYPDIWKMKNKRKMFRDIYSNNKLNNQSKGTHINER